MEVGEAGLVQLLRIFRLGFSRLRLRFRLGGSIFVGFELGEFVFLGFCIRLMLRLRLLGPVRFVLGGPGWDEVDGEGLGGFLQEVGGNILSAGGLDWGEAEGKELGLLVRDGRVGDEDQGFVAQDGDEQQ